MKRTKNRARRMLTPVADRTLTAVASQFEAVLRAGILIADAVEIIAAECADRRMRAILTDCSRRLAEGESLADAFSAWGRAIPPVFVETVRAGESCGRLAESFLQLRAYFDARDTRKRKLRGALRYPAFLLALSAVVVYIVITRLLPVMESLSQSLTPSLSQSLSQSQSLTPSEPSEFSNADLFPTTKLLLLLAEPRVTRVILCVVAVSMACAATLFVLSRVGRHMMRTRNGSARGQRVHHGRRGQHGQHGRLERFCVFMSKLWLRSPVTGKLARLIASAQLSRTFTILIEAGVPLTQSLRVTAGTVNASAIGEALLDAADAVEGGAALGDALAGCGEILLVVREMAAVGGETSTLTRTMGAAADFCDREADAESERLLSLLEPALTVIMGAFVAVLVISIYVPMFSMYEMIGV